MSELIQNTKVYFEDLSHSYWTTDGKCLLGVTSLMRKHGLSPDYSAISEDVLAKAAERGSAIHKAIESYCKGLDYDHAPEVGQFAAQKLDVAANEYLVSDGTTIASSIDIVLADNSLCDIKTTSSLHLDSVQWQLSIYAYLFELQNPTLKVPALYALHIRNGKCRKVELQRIGGEVIAGLLEAERSGRKFDASDSALPVPQRELSISADYAKAYEILSYIDNLKQEIEQYEAQIAVVKSAILAAMTDNNVTSMENEYFKITRVSESTRTTIDSKKLAELFPEAYASCKVESTTAASVRLTMRK